MIDTPITDGSCASVFFTNGTATIAADPDVCRRLERELNKAKDDNKQLRRALTRIASKLSKSRKYYDVMMIAVRALKGTT